MKWWIKALTAIALLIVLDACYAFVMYRYIHNTSSNVQVESIRHEKLGEVCGLILGSGVVLILASTYFNKRK